MLVNLFSDFHRGGKKVKILLDESLCCINFRDYIRIVKFLCFLSLLYNSRKKIINRLEGQNIPSETCNSQLMSILNDQILV